MDSYPLNHDNRNTPLVTVFDRLRPLTTNHLCLRGKERTPMNKNNQQATAAFPPLMWTKEMLGQINIPKEKRLELMTQLCAALIIGKRENYYHDHSDGTSSLKTCAVSGYYGAGRPEKEQVPEVVCDAASLLTEIEQDILASIKLGSEAAWRKTAACASGEEQP